MYLRGAVFVPQSAECQEPDQYVEKISMTHVLVNEKDGNVFPLLREPVKRLLYSRVFGSGVDYEEVLLCIRRLGDMLRNQIGQRAAYDKEPWFIPQRLLEAGR